jgi:hypothetical protein
LGRVCLFKRKLNGTILVVLLFFFFRLVFAPVLRPAALVESETIAETAPTGEPFLFARQQIVIRPLQEKIMPA